MCSDLVLDLIYKEAFLLSQYGVISPVQAVDTTRIQLNHETQQLPVSSTGSLQIHPVIV